jgi:hypothetical protein
MNELKFNSNQPFDCRTFVSSIKRNLSSKIKQEYEAAN